MVKIAIDRHGLNRICEANHIRELALFGSVLRDDFRTESDVDVLVEFEPGAHIGLFGFAALASELESHFRRKVDLVTKKSLSPYVRDQILASREIMYERAE